MKDNIKLGDHLKEEGIHPQHKEDVSLFIIVFCFSLVGCVTIFYGFVKLVLWLVSKNVID
jgi:hypothetical protein